MKIAMRRMGLLIFNVLIIQIGLWLSNHINTKNTYYFGVLFGVAVTLVIVFVVSENYFQPEEDEKK